MKKNKLYDTEKYNWDHSITSNKSWLNFTLNEVYQYKYLIYLFVKRDFVTFYKQTILGPLWYVIQPLLMTVVFTLVFSNIAKISTEGVPPFIFYLSGTVVWGYFATCFTQTGSIFVTNAQIFGKVYFPRITVPIATAIVTLFQFFIQFFIFIGFLLFFIFNGSQLYPSLYVLFLPLILIQIAILSVGIGMVVSALTAKYRDLTFAMGFLVQLWMFMTPVVYPLSIVPEKFKLLIILNPMTAPVEFFREAFLGASSISLNIIYISWIVSVVIFFMGVVLFTKIEKTFMDTV